MSRIVVVEAGLASPSSTRLLADRITEALAGPHRDVQRVSLRELAHPLAEATLTGFPAGDLAAAVEAVGQADGLVVVSPVFAASYSGLFKMFFDVLEPGALRGVPVLLAATGGTPRHSLVLEHALRPLLSYLGARTVPTGVYAAAEDWGGVAGSDTGPASALDERISRAARELLGDLGDPTASGGPDEESARTVGRGPDPTREFAAPESFTELLRRTAR